MRVAVIGASGFVGASFIEQALRDGAFEVVPVIHSSGNAWRLIRHGLSLRTANLLDKDSVKAAVEGCTHVVNCSRGDNEVMLKGLRHLLEISGEARLEGFIHLSSVLVYGNVPAPDSAHESGATPPQPLESYGGMKLRQDKMVERAAAGGLPCLILCPPNISGPYSYFLGGIVDSIRKRALALLDEGGAVCNMVDVYNLAHAVALGLDRCSTQASRLFVTDDEDITWGQIVDALRPLCDEAPRPPSIGRGDLVKMRDQLFAKPKMNLARSLKHLVSSDVRAALRKDPLWASIDRVMRKGVARLGAAFEDQMRLAVEGPLQVAPAPAPLNVPLTVQQLRGVRHSCELAKARIGYRPRYSFAESMEAYRAWYRSITGRTSASWSLARYLWQ
jgi:nucleoside-diphosphate-sugar epimerase